MFIERRQINPTVGLPYFFWLACGACLGGRRDVLAAEEAVGLAASSNFCLLPEKSEQPLRRKKLQLEL